MPITNMNSSTISANGASSTITVASQGSITGAYNINTWNGISASNISSAITTSIPNSAISVRGTSGAEIVRLNRDGTVTWNGEINVDEAAKAFSEVMQVGAEMSAGITYSVKQRMRDTVFEELISMAKEKGSLTAEDLTYLHTAAKIMDKLKGKE